MAKQHTRQAVISRLNKTLQNGHAIIVTGAGIGLSAKCQEKGGSDLIVVYNSGKFRMNGLSSTAGNLPIGDANAIVYELGERVVLPIVKETPVIAGVYGVDPTRDIVRFLKSLKDLGFSGVINFPTVARLDGKFRDDLEKMGLGFEREVEMISQARQLDLFTMAYVFNPDEARMMAKAGTDVLVAHMGVTSGGLTGTADVMSLDDAVNLTNEIIAAGDSVRNDLIHLSHGGPISGEPEVRYVMSRTKAVGFVAASSVERTPVENAIIGAVENFKNIRVKKFVDEVRNDGQAGTETAN